jgi:Putative transposase DNA-binding domain
MIRRGELGVKAGRGFYDWSERDADAVKERRGTFLCTLARRRDEPWAGPAPTQTGHEEEGQQEPPSRQTPGGQSAPQDPQQAAHLSPRRSPQEAGLLVVVVNPVGTSQICSRCGRSAPKDLGQRWHTCPYEDCGLSIQRDHNGARNVLNRTGLADPLRGYPVAQAPAAESPGVSPGECQPISTTYPRQDLYLNRMSPRSVTHS